MRNNNALLISILLCLTINTIFNLPVSCVKPSQKTSVVKPPKKTINQWAIYSYVGTFILFMLGVTAGTVSFFDPCFTNEYCQLISLVSGGSLTVSSIICLMKFCYDDHLQNKISILKQAITFGYEIPDETIPTDPNIAISNFSNDKVIMFAHCSPIDKSYFNSSSSSSSDDEQRQFHLSDSETDDTP